MSDFVGGRARSNPFMFGFTGTLGVLVAYALVRGIAHAKSVLILVIIAIFIAVGLDPLVRKLVARGIKRPLAVTLVMLATLLVFAGLAWAVVPALTSQITELVNAAPGWVARLQSNKTMHNLDLKYHWVSKVDSYITSGSLIRKAIGGLYGVGIALAGVLFSILTVFILTVYFLASLPQTKATLYRLVPQSRRRRFTDLTEQILSDIGGYVAGKAVVGLATAVVMFVFFLLIGMSQFAIALATAVAVLGLIPVVGGWSAAVVAGLVALSFGVWHAVICAGFTLVWFQIEAYLVQPRIMRHAIEVPGMVTVLAALLGGAVMGLVGAVISVPLAAAIMLLVRELWLTKTEKL